MSKRQLVMLFVSALVFGTIGAVMGALLPMYATRLGADPTLAGLYFSSTFVALTAGSLVAGRLSDRLHRRKVFLIFAGVVQAAALWLMGQVTEMGMLFAVTFITFLMVGMQITFVNILVGLFADEAERGRVFGMLATTNPLGALMGGVVSSGIVARWGFSGLFTVAALFTLIGPAAGLLLKDKRTAAANAAPSAAARGALLSATFLLLFFANTLAAANAGVQVLGRSLLMDRLGFDASALSTTLAVGGLIGLPFPLLLGWISDRIGRKPVLMFTYLAVVASLLVLMSSSVLWQFWLSTALQWISVASMGLGAALVTDIVPAEALGAGLARFGATTFIGLVIGTAVTGAAIQNLGMETTFIIGALTALIGVGMVGLIRRPAAAPVGLAAD